MNTRVNARDHIAPTTTFNLIVAWTVSLVVGPIAILATAAATMGFALIGWLVAGIAYFSRVKKARAALKGSAVRVDATQFPQIHQTACHLAERLGMGDVPEIYIIESNTQNAFALKHGSKRYVVLLDDVVHGALTTGNERVLSFLVGHELAHHALGHTNMIRGFLSSFFKPLSRADEFTCDSVGHALAGDELASRDALALLLVGPHLYRSLDRSALDNQARQVADDKYSRRAERPLSHPLLLRRYARLLTLTPTGA